jgi:hypothetical protein
MSRGSRWNIWDFHLHTPYSVLNNQFGDCNDEATWNNYVEKLESKAKSQGIAAIGITDYFHIEGYKRVLGYQKSGRLSGLFLFPNIEFRIDKIIYRSKNGGEPKRLNVHVLFSPEVPTSDIEEHFLHDLDFVHESEPFEGSTKRKLKISNLKEFGLTLQQQHPNFQGRSPLEIGCMNAMVQIEKIKQALEDRRFRGKYILVLAEEDMALMDWNSQDHALRKQLAQMAHAIFSSNPKSRCYWLGHCHQTLEDYLAEFKTQKPCIWGCDSHGFEQRFLEPDYKRYCWIKGEVSWEGLKQVIYEPEERVRIQEHNPETVKSYFTLDEVQIKETKANPNLSINATQLKLNPNLVTIIGGRGSGKTALLDLIASCFAAGQQLASNKVSFYYRLFGEHATKHKKTVQPIHIGLRFKSGEFFEKFIGRDIHSFESTDILYLTLLMSTQPIRANSTNT